MNVKKIFRRLLKQIGVINKTRMESFKSQTEKNLEEFQGHINSNGKDKNNDIYSDIVHDLEGVMSCINRYERRQKEISKFNEFKNKS